MICTEISTKKIELISGLYFFAFFSEQREYGRRKKRRKRGIGACVCHMHRTIYLSGKGKVRG